MYPKEDLYQVLGITKESTEKEIQAAWRKRMGEYHGGATGSLDRIREKFPQKPKETDDAYDARIIKQREYIIQILNIARDILIDSKSRADYNLYRAKNPSSTGEKSRARKENSNSQKQGAGHSSDPQDQHQKTAKDGSSYVGEMNARGQRHGHGQQKWPDHSLYTGEWKNDKENGRGTYIWPNGDQYTGEWREGKRHGQGTYTYSDGRTKKGEWKNGIFQEKNQQKATSPDYIGELKVRPFFLADFKGFLTTEYGIKDGVLYHKTDFLGLGDWGGEKLHLKNLGTPSHEGWLYGTANFPGMQGANTICWHNVLHPKEYAETLNAHKNGAPLKTELLSANKAALYLTPVAALGLVLNLFFSGGNTNIQQAQPQQTEQEKIVISPTQAPSSLSKKPAMKEKQKSAEKTPDSTTTVLRSIAAFKQSGKPQTLDNAIKFVRRGLSGAKALAAFNDEAELVKPFCDINRDAIASFGNQNMIALAEFCPEEKKKSPLPEKVTGLSFAKTIDEAGIGMVGSLSELFAKLKESGKMSALEEEWFKANEEDLKISVELPQRSIVAFGNQGDIAICAHIRR